MKIIMTDNDYKYMNILVIGIIGLTLGYFAYKMYKECKQLNTQSMKLLNYERVSPKTCYEEDEKLISLIENQQKQIDSLVNIRRVDKDNVDVKSKSEKQQRSSISMNLLKDIKEISPSVNRDSVKHNKNYLSTFGMV